MSDAETDSGQAEQSTAEFLEGECQVDEDCLDFIPCSQEPCPLFACRDSFCSLIQPCGDNECNELEYCCNESCGICVRFDNDNGCTEEFCESRTTEVRKVGSFLHLSPCSARLSLKHTN